MVSGKGPKKNVTRKFTNLLGINRNFSDQGSISDYFLLSPWLIWASLLFLCYLLTFTKLRGTDQPLRRLELAQRWADSILHWPVFSKSMSHQFLCSCIALHCCIVYAPSRLEICSANRTLIQTPIGPKSRCQAPCGLLSADDTLK